MDIDMNLIESLKFFNDLYNFEKFNNVDNLLINSTQAIVDLNNDLIAG